MSHSFDDIEKLSKALSAEDRARLAESLLESLHMPTSPDLLAAWETEVANRVAAHDSANNMTHDAADVFAEARALINSGP